MATRTYADVVDLAQSNGGRCLSAPSEFVDTKSSLRFACAAGHEWTTRVTNLLHRGRWCPDCGAANSPPLTLEDIRKMAVERGGECLSDTYQGIHRKHIFRCTAGHVWEAQPANLRHRGSWCPVCAEIPRALTPAARSSRLDEIHAIARSRLGRCLSKEYLGDKVHLLFGCADGHQWWAMPNTIKRPHWCPFCKHGQPKAEVITGIAREFPGANALKRRSTDIQRLLKTIADQNDAPQ